MKLKCSRGCTYDTDNIMSRSLKPGDKCPNELSYDRMHVPATTYCQRVLNPICDKCGEVIKKRKSCRVCKGEYRYKKINGRVIICIKCYRLFIKTSINQKGEL